MTGSKRRTSEDWQTGDAVTWEEDGCTYNGAITMVLSAQLLVMTTLGTERFVMKNDSTLKRYKVVQE